MIGIHWYDLVILFIMLAVLAIIVVGIVFTVRADARRSPRNEG